MMTKNDVEIMKFRPMRPGAQGKHPVKESIDQPDNRCRLSGDMLLCRLTDLAEVAVIVACSSLLSSQWTYRQLALFTAGAPQERGIAADLQEAGMTSISNAWIFEARSSGVSREISALR